MMKNLRYLTLVGITLSLFALSGCDGSGKPAIGIEDEILVFADSLDYVEMEETLQKVFGKIIYTPQPENLFNLEWRDITKINNYKRRKNIIIIAPLGEQTNASVYMGNLLDSNVTQMVKSGKEFFFTKYDQWAKNQLVMVLTSNSLNELRDKIEANQDDLLYYFQKISAVGYGADFKFVE